MDYSDAYIPERREYREPGGIHPSDERTPIANLVPLPKQLDPFNYAIEIRNFGAAPARNVKILINGKLLGNAAVIPPNDSIIHKTSYLAKSTINVKISWTDDAGPHWYEKDVYLI